MSQNFSERNETLLDQAVAARLAKLRSLPTDTARIDRLIREQIPAPVAQQRRYLTQHPFQAVAASLLLLSSIVAVVLLAVSSGPVLAEPLQMAKVHEDIVAGRVPVMQVNSIDAANRMLNTESPDSPKLPNVPDSHVMACCMKSVQNKQMACVLLKNDGVPITLAVAHAADMKLGPAPIVTKDGVDYRVQAVGDLNMVMTTHDGKWLCLIGKLPSDRLMDVASQVRF